MKSFLTLVVAFMLAACSTTGVLPRADGTYMIEKTVSQIFPGSIDSAKADAYQEAANFCGGERKAVETIKFEATTGSGFTKLGNVFLEFRCK
jgi:hypothetical protein